MTLMTATPIVQREDVDSTVLQSAAAPSRRRPPGGSRKGSPNKLSASVREGIQRAYDELGGANALLAWARENPTVFYTQLWAKLLPMEINAQGGTELIVRVVRFSDTDPASALAK
jgi:hypothetical protein